MYVTYQSMKQQLDELLRVNIKQFDDGGDTTTATDTPPTEEKDADKGDEKDNKTPEKTFTQEEVDKILANRLAREKKAAQEALAEAEKLAKMNADDKQKYEFEKLQRENAELRAAQNRSLMGEEASRMLAESDIIATKELLNLVVKDDAEQTKEAVNALTGLVNGLVDKAVKEKLRGTPPKKPTGNGKVYTKEEIMSISDDFERKRLMAENWHLFKK